MISKIRSFLGIKTREEKEDVINEYYLNSMITMVGIDSAGKTALLYKYVRDEIVNSIPTIGFNCERTKINDTKYVIYDIVGSGNMPMLWHQYYKSSKGIIYVIDETG